MKQLISIVLFVLTPALAYSAEFFCPSGGTSTCLTAAINEANGLPGEHIINLEPGIYTLQMALPSIGGSIRIQATADDAPTVIERAQTAPAFSIFGVSATGSLTLSGLTVQRGGGSFLPGAAIRNAGKTLLEDSIITDNHGESGAINNVGILNLFRTIVSDNTFRARCRGNTQ